MLHSTYCTCNLHFQQIFFLEKESTVTDAIFFFGEIFENHGYLVFTNLRDADSVSFFCVVLFYREFYFVLRYENVFFCKLRNKKFDCITISVFCATLESIGKGLEKSEIFN